MVRGEPLIIATCGRYRRNNVWTSEIGESKEHGPRWGFRMFNIRRILYATDFSSYSNLAYFHAVTLAERYEASLTVANVWTPGSDCGDANGCRTQLETIRPNNPHIPVHHVFLEGEP